MAKLETKPVDIKWLIVMNFIMMFWVVFSLWKPLQLPNFKIEYAMLLATAVIAISAFATVRVQIDQRRMQKEHHEHDIQIANVNHKFALFEKRLDAYKALEDFLVKFILDGHITHENHRSFNQIIGCFLFLIPEQQEGFINELRQKIKKAMTAHRNWSFLVKIKNEERPLTDIEERAKAAFLLEMQINENWIFNQWKEGRLKEEFEPLLKIPSEVIYGMGS